MEGGGLEEWEDDGVNVWQTGGEGHVEQSDQNVLCWEQEEHGETSTAHVVTKAMSSE